MPVTKAVTSPVPASTLAFSGLLLLQTPDGVVFDNIIVAPGQILALPVVVATAGSTVTTAVTKYPGDIV